MLKNKFKKYLAFTLAEVLITLGIIGIVAEMTIPSIYSNYQKQLVSVRVEKFYSMMDQAIKRSEVDNNSTSSWDHGTDGATWFNTYLKPYIKCLNSSTSGSYVTLDLTDGTYVFISLHASGWHSIIVYWGNENYWDSRNISGKNMFWFRLDETTKTNALAPYDWAMGGYDRNTWLTACKTTNTQYCTGLIMVDGWQIKSDYPYFN